MERKRIVTVIKPTTLTSLALRHQTYSITAFIIYGKPGLIHNLYFQSRFSAFIYPVCCSLEFFRRQTT